MATLDFSYSLSELIRSLRPFALRLTKDREEANDLMQETLYKAFNNRDKYLQGTNLKAWLYTIMRNTFITNYQKLIKRNTFVDHTENLHYLNSNSTDSMANTDLALEEINKAINTLDESFKEPFMMYFNGFKYHEIADKLEVPIGTVKNRIHLARKELKGKLRVYAN